MASVNLLVVDDGEPRLVTHKHMEGDTERVEPDAYGVLRNSDGEAYSAGAYAIIDRPDDGDDGDELRGHNDTGDKPRP